MTHRIGLWIDHKQAVIVSLAEQQAAIKKIDSGAKRVQYRGAPRPRTPYSAQYQKGDDQLDKQYVQRLNKYYERVISLLHEARAVLIFGPGEAKSELKKHLEGEKGRRHDICIEPSDKMTDRQIVARVRKYFQENGAGS
jgi:stalled ribosome rescue protein Dom34